MCIPVQYRLWLAISSHLAI